MKKAFFFLFCITLSSCGINEYQTGETSKTDSEHLTVSNESLATEESIDSVFSDSVVETSASTASVPLSDPYTNVDKTDFYANYSVATSYEDAQYRTKHYLLSGSNEDQSQIQKTEDNPPMDGDKYVFNSASGLSADGLSYEIMDKNGKTVDTIYKGGAYITLEEVAAYVYAFGDVPPNYNSNTSLKPTKSEWGKYLRVNHNHFTGDTSRYKYEPTMPDLDTKTYYEIDIGTTGCTEYNTGYSTAPYNTGSKITRGSCRIVYTRYYSSGGLISDISERYVFYTYNHYNDFQQYLNYQYGWGKWFGNMAGGGSMNNNTAKYKTEYPEVSKRPFR